MWRRQKKVKCREKKAEWRGTASRRWHRPGSLCLVHLRLGIEQARNCHTERCGQWSPQSLSSQPPCLVALEGKTRRRGGLQTTAALLQPEKLQPPPAGASSSHRGPSHSLQDVPWPTRGQRDARPQHQRWAWGPQPTLQPSQVCHGRSTHRNRLPGSGPALWKQTP